MLSVENTLRSRGRTTTCRNAHKRPRRRSSHRRHHVPNSWKGAGSPSRRLAIVVPLRRMSSLSGTAPRAGQPRTVKVPGTGTRQAGLDRAFVKDSVGTYRKDGQDRAPPTPVATACSNHPGQSRSAAGHRQIFSHVTHYPERIARNF